MSTDGNKATAVHPKTPAVTDETRETGTVQHADEGIGVFRGLIMMALFYVVFGFLIWFAWSVFSQWRGH